MAYTSKSKKARLAQRWEEASAELEAAKAKQAEGRFAWDDATVKANAEVELPLNLDATVANSGANRDYIQEKYGIEFAKPVETRTAPTTNPTRPRATHLAYMKDTELLLVQFRDGTIVEYSGIPEVMWQDLKVTNSTGKYIDSSGIYEYPYRKVPKDQMPQELSVLFD